MSLADGDLVYIRNEGDGTEELYNERNDPRELTNRAGSGYDEARPGAIPRASGPDQKVTRAVGACQPGPTEFSLSSGESGAMRPATILIKETPPLALRRTVSA